MAQVNKAHLTPPKRRLIELMQDINFGRITNIPVRDGEPELTPDTVIEREIKLGGQSGPRPERDQDDFILKQEVVALLDPLARGGGGELCLHATKHGLRFLRGIEERPA